MSVDLNILTFLTGNRRITMMELLYFLPGAGMPKEELIHRTIIVNSIVRLRTNVTVIEVGEGLLSIESSIHLTF